jgi:hypothetical protein
MTMLERAFELARDGDVRTIEQIRSQLNREGYESASAHLMGTTLRKQLTALINARQK